jgi:hypothetical protein
MMASLSSVSNSAPQEQTSRIILRPARTNKPDCLNPELSGHVLLTVVAVRRFYFVIYLHFNAFLGIAIIAVENIIWHDFPFFVELSGNAPESYLFPLVALQAVETIPAPIT